MHEARAWSRACQQVVAMAWPDLLVQDLIPTVLLAGLAYQAMTLEYGFTAALAVGGITIINGVTLDQLLRSIAATKREDAERQRAPIEERER
jgi:predicted nucleic acid-binding protein